MPQIPIFVINLKRSEGRRKRIQETLDSLGLTYEFIEAVDGNDFSDSEVAEIQAGQSDCWDHAGWQRGTNGTYIALANRSWQACLLTTMQLLPDRLVTGATPVKLRKVVSLRYFAIHIRCTFKSCLLWAFVL